MAKLLDVNQLNAEEFVEALRGKEIVVYEEVQGSKIWVNWDGKSWTIRPKTLSSTPINLVDLATQKFYNKAFLYFFSITQSAQELMPRNWHFCFEYFPDKQPANIKYEHIPKNNLVLTCIYKGGKRYHADPNELMAYAKMLGTDSVPVIFQGVLSDKRLSMINYFVHTSPKDLEFVFDENNFAKFFYKALNPAAKASFLMDDDSFQGNLERLIVKVEGSSPFSFALLNPLYVRANAGTSTEFTDVYSLLLINFIQFCNGIELDGVTGKGGYEDEVYVDVICKLFNLYMIECSDDIEQFEIVIPPFFGQDKFAINRDAIKNKATLAWIDKSHKVEYVLKVMLGSFNKQKKKPVGVFTEHTLVAFNKLVNRISTHVRQSLKFAKSEEEMQDKLMDFDEFTKLKIDTDATGKIYHNKYPNDTDDSGKKKKGIKKKSDLDFDFDLGLDPEIMGKL